jgi:lipase chaperone LimK
MATDGPDDELLLEAYAIIDTTPEMDETIAKILDLPPAIARAFVADMKAFFAEENRYKQDEIALRQLHALKEHQGLRGKPLRLSDVKQMFLQMKDEA